MGSPIGTSSFVGSFSNVNNDSKGKNEVDPVRSTMASIRSTLGGMLDLMAEKKPFFEASTPEQILQDIMYRLTILTMRIQLVTGPFKQVSTKEEKLSEMAKMLEEKEQLLKKMEQYNKMISSSNAFQTIIAGEKQ